MNWTVEVVEENISLTVESAGPQGPAGEGGGGGGVSDHGALTGLADDDHTQYLNNTRGDARYYTQSQVDTALSGKASTSHSHVISDVTGLQTAIDGKAASSHSHVISDVTGLQTAIDGKEASGTAASAVSTHVAASDPHTQYHTDTRGDARYYTKTQLDSSSGKVDKVSGKQLSTEDYTSAEKTKLSGIATGATANSSDATLLSRANHTGTQAASTIVQDASNRFVTDTEKSTWDAKQDALWGDGVSIYSPGTSTLINSFGGTALSTSGTMTHPLPSVSNMVTQTYRWNVASAATAGAGAENRFLFAKFWRGDSAGLGGFYTRARFAIGSTTSGQTFYTGLTEMAGAAGGVLVPSSLTLCIGLGFDGGDTNFFVMHNDASGTCTRVDTGIPIDTTSWFDTIIYAPPNDTYVSVQLINCRTGASFTTTVTTDLPPATTLMIWRIFMNNQATAGAVSYNCCKVYLKTEY